MHLPDVLLITGSDHRREEFRVYADHTGASVHMTADTTAATDLWKAAPLVVIAPDMAATVITSTLPDNEHCGDVVLLTASTLPLALQAGIAAGAGYVVHEGIGAPWLLTMMRKAAVRGTEARRALDEARNTDR
ncbi:hypothetical protein ABZ671_18725 [Micromonospora sp. NPDC006766]|uniref:hypothetical protein n=1 Tax=Micromonospora sp. NPDC006766 TaxID=3154778 RepID=UPI0033C614B8